VSSASNFEPNKNCTILGYYAANNSNFLPTFRDNLLVPSSGFKGIDKKYVPLKAVIQTWPKLKFMRWGRDKTSLVNDSEVVIGNR
jgi:hypothetical protein